MGRFRMGCRSKGLIKKRFSKKLLLFVIIGTLFLSASLIIKISQNVKGDEGGIKSWLDEFKDTTNIDKSKSYNITVENGMAFMNNTYDTWDAPFTSWKKLKEIPLTNLAGSNLNNYLLHLKIQYDDNMDKEFNDIRFKTDYNYLNNLNYWIEYFEESSFADVWVKVLEIPYPYVDDVNLHLFYNNKNAVSESLITSVFSDFEGEKWSSDKKIAEHENYKQGCWDPVVSYGDDNFLIVWEEGYFCCDSCWPKFGYKQNLLGSIYDINGDKKFDGDIFTDSSYLYYRNENPKIAFNGEDKWLVVWEHYIPTNVNNYCLDDDEINILARVITINQNGNGFNNGIESPICGGYNLVYKNPFIEFDSINNRFCIVWEKQSNTNNEIWGGIYQIIPGTYNIQSVISNRLLDSNNKAYTPCVAFNPSLKQYMIVWKNDSTNLPSISSRLYDENLNPISGTIKASKNNHQCSYPCVEFCETTKSYLLTYGYTYNNAKGIWPTLINEDGTVKKIGIEAIASTGDELTVDSDIEPYLSSYFIVTYTTSGPYVYAKLVDSTDLSFIDPYLIELSSSNCYYPRNPKISFGKGKIFTVWEDKRIWYYQYREPNIYGNMWHLYYNQVNIGDFSEEKEQILDACLVSTPIPNTSPSDVIDWQKIYFQFYKNLNTDFTVDILDQVGNTIKSNVISNTNLGLGEDGYGINNKYIRLKANFSRDAPNKEVMLDYWEIDYESSSINPNDIIVSFDYSEIKPCYKKDDEITIYAYLSNLPEELGTNSFVKITIKDEEENILNESEEMTNIYNSGCPFCDWEYIWTVPDGHDGDINVSITIEENNVQYPIAYPSYDISSKDIDNTDPIIEGYAYTTGYDSATIHAYVTDEGGCGISNSYLDYDLSTNYEYQKQYQGNYLYFELKGLLENRTYHYKITTYDIAGNQVNTFDNIFTTGKISYSQNYSQGDKITADAGGPYIGSINESIEFNGSKSFSPNGTIIWYKWDFENDGTYDKISLVTPTASHSYKKVGNFTVKLEIWDNFNQTASDTSLVIISETYSEKFDNLTKDNKTMVDIKGTTDTIIVFLEITPSRDLTNVEITTNDYGNYKPEETIKEPKVEDLKELLNKTAQNISIDIYRYIDISILSNDYYINDFDIKTTDVVFKINQDWLEQNNIEADNVTLIRYHNNKWEKINTTFIGQADEHSWHLSKVPGFSTFAVVGSKVVEKGEPLNPEDKPIPWILIFGFIISAVVILIFILFKTKFIYIEEVDIKEKE